MLLLALQIVIAERIMEDRLVISRKLAKIIRTRKVWTVNVPEKWPSAHVQLNAKSLDANICLAQIIHLSAERGGEVSEQKAIQCH